MDQKEVPVETEICHNCKREVPQQNYVMHVAHCARNMAVCPVCGDAVPKAQLKEHRIKEHALVECKDCRFKLQSGAMEHHKATSCGKRIVSCAFCELELPHCDMTDHENYCGSRTERCECDELVMLKYKKLHLDSNHGFLKLDDEPGPTPSWKLPRQTTKVPSPQMSSLRSALPNIGRTENTSERNVNSTPVENKASYKTQFPSNAVSPPPMQRQPITPYDATEDLRAKVKLVRHDLNEIKQTYLERKEKVENKNMHRNNLDIEPTKRKTEKFVTNLVPYEKSQSHKVNSVPLDENPKNFYNYLGEKENPIKTFVPISNVKAQKNLFTGSSNNDQKAVKTLVKEKIIYEKQISNPKEKNESQRTESSASQSHERACYVSDTPRTGATPKPKSSNGAVPKRGENGSTPRRRKAPPPPIPTPQPEPEDVILPCEFCEKMIPASELVQHETGCRPDLAQLNLVARHVVEQVEQPRSRSPEVELPCEFCCSLYPASKLLNHQQLCGV